MVWGKTAHGHKSLLIVTDVSLTVEKYENDILIWLVALSYRKKRNNIPVETVNKLIHSVTSGVHISSSSKVIKLINKAENFWHMKYTDMPIN